MPSHSAVWSPNCCSRVGACPCFCTGSATVFSLALTAFWAALAMLITAMSLTDLFEVGWAPSIGWSGQLGMWQVCAYNLGGYSYGWSCASYGDQVGVDDAFYGQGSAFNAMRVLTIIATATTFVAAILAPIRLALQQRAKPISPILSWTLLASAVVSLVSVTIAFGLSMRTVQRHSIRAVGQWRLQPHHQREPGRVRGRY